MKYAKRNKQGKFRKARKWLRRIKIGITLYLAYQYLEPALNEIWIKQAEPYLAQLLK